jgi:hypothetical protein
VPCSTLGLPKLLVVEISAGVLIHAAISYLDISVSELCFIAEVSASVATGCLSMQFKVVECATSLGLLGNPLT